VANPFIYAEVRLPQDDLLTPPLAGLPAETRIAEGEPVGCGYRFGLYPEWYCYIQFCWRKSGETRI